MMVWWIQVSRPSRLEEWYTTTWRLRASQAQAEKLAAEINAAENDYQAIAFSGFELTTIDRFGDKETAALGWVPDRWDEWWMTVSTDYGAGESSETVYRIAANRRRVEALAAKINAQNGPRRATAHDVPAAVSLADVIQWEDGALGTPLDPQAIEKELADEAFETELAETAR